MIKTNAKELDIPSKEELKKEIESLKKKTFYLMIGILTTSIIYLSSTILQSRQYATIQDYYYDSLEDDRELNKQLREQNQALEEILSNLQSRQIQKN